VGNVSNKVGDLLPKGRVGDSRLESVFGWQFVIAYRLANQFPSEYKGQIAYRQCNLLAKGCLPDEKGCSLEVYLVLTKIPLIYCKYHEQD
jgi:hypothetical protein